MKNNTELYDQYELLLPSKSEGGYLIIALYDKVKANEINEQFTITEIKYVLNEISSQFGQSNAQPERLLKILLHYFLRNNTDEPGKYYLTDYAKKVVESMINKLGNPYKNFPLKKSFDDYFTKRVLSIETISDLEGNFGGIFIDGPKNVINDHFEALEDELRQAYEQLNKILQSDEESATALVKQFVIAFRTFGEKAEDITKAINSKDKFLHDLQSIVDKFYARLENFKQPLIDQESEDLQRLKKEWEKAIEIYKDIENFFKSIDNKASYIRRQINNASDKLSELHEQFSVKTHLRLQIKRLFKIALESASYKESGIVFNTHFPLKKLVNENTRFFYPEHYDFIQKAQNQIIQIPHDEEYEQKERNSIEIENKRQQVINDWIEKAKLLLKEQKTIILSEMMQTIIEQESDLSIAYHVAAEMIAFVSDNKDNQIIIEQKLISLNDSELSLWQTKLINSPVIPS